MSLIRPELSQWLCRWREPLIWAVLGLAGIKIAFDGARGLQLVFGLLVFLTAAAFFVAAIRRIRLADPTPGAGIVQIDEGRIAYFGPLGGAFIDVAALERVEIRGRFWCLTGRDGAQIYIPRGAEGAERLPDALSVLPGISFDPNAKVMWSREHAQSQTPRA